MKKNTLYFGLVLMLLFSLTTSCSAEEIDEMEYGTLNSLEKEEQSEATYNTFDSEY